MPTEAFAEFDFAARLLLAAILGAGIGLEREVHDHPAGMRTHMLVSVGSAAFTVLSMTVFASPNGDPGRVAAQIVSGIGFLGAGAIVKEGATVRGLTTAASLWAVAAVGMAAGAGSWGIAGALTVIVIVSLWPLRLVTERFVGRKLRTTRLKLATTDPHALGRAVALVAAKGGVIGHLATSAAPGGGLTIQLELRTEDAGTGAEITAAIADLDDLELLESVGLGD